MNITTLGTIAGAAIIILALAALTARLLHPPNPTNPTDTTPCTCQHPHALPTAGWACTCTTEHENDDAPGIIVAFDTDPEEPQ